MEFSKNYPLNQNPDLLRQRLSLHFSASLKIVWLVSLRPDLLRQRPSLHFSASLKICLACLAAFGSTDGFLKIASSDG